MRFFLFSKKYIASAGKLIKDGKICMTKQRVCDRIHDVCVVRIARWIIGNGGNDGLQEGGRKY